MQEIEGDQVKREETEDEVLELSESDRVNRLRKWEQQ